MQPIIVNRQTRREVANSIKVIAFNAKGGRHLQGICRCLARPPLDAANVILLSDVDWCRPRSNFKKIAAELAAVLEMSFAFAPKQRVMGPNSYAGNAILSSQPLFDVAAVPLSKPQSLFTQPDRIGAPHGMLAMTVYGGQRITLGVSHLTARWNPAGRSRQMAEYIAAMPDGPAIIGGDFNTTTLDLSAGNSLLRALREVTADPLRFRFPELHEPLFQQLNDAGFELQACNIRGKATFTYSRAIPPPLRPKLDWLAVRHLTPVPGSARVIPARLSLLGRRVSDHDFVMCRIQL